MNWTQFKKSCLSHVSHWHCGNILGILHRRWQVRIIFLKYNIFLSFNSSNSVKTFRQNSSNVPCCPVTPDKSHTDEQQSPATTKHFCHHFRCMCKKTEEKSITSCVYPLLLMRLQIWRARCN